MDRKPWLNDDGQSVQELIALAETHRIDSILYALEQALQEKEENRWELTAAENVVLAVEALQREVNNGGFRQFFMNSSRVYAPIISDVLKSIGADDAARVVSKALHALAPAALTADAVLAAATNAITENSQDIVRDLDYCDQAYYKIRGIDEKLFAFVQANAAHINV